MANKFCALGCPPSKNYFIFPSLAKEKVRRNFWLDFFDMEEPYHTHVYACERHFSHFQTSKGGLKRDAVPDIPVVCNTSNPTYRRKVRDLRTNVIVVTPRDPEFIIYRNQTGIFHESLFNFANPLLSPPPLQPKPLLQVPIIKSVSCSMVTQTNTRLCGSVQISEYLDEFRLNCFYCIETFLLQNWSEFVKHLKDKHFEQEQAFEMSKYLSEDHDYTPLRTPPSSPITKRINAQILAEPIAIEPPPVVIDLTEDNASLPTLSPPTQSSPPPPPSPPPLTPKPTAAETNDKSMNLNLANKLIKLLDETVLSPDFRRTEEDNIVVIKKKVVETLQSNFLRKIIAEEARPTTSVSTSNCVPLNKKSQMSNSSTSASKFTRPLYTLNYGQKNVISVRNTPVLKKSIKKRKPIINTPEVSVQDADAVIDEQPVTSYLAQANASKRSKSLAKRTVQQAIKNITTFENIYQTVKTRATKVLSSGVFYVKDMNSNKVTEMQTSNKTPLSRCLRRATGLVSAFTPLSIETLQQKPIELVFEYSPKDVINSLLDNMKYFPVLWEFHDSPFNINYSSAISDLCKIINKKWSLNINPLKMRSSVNRILKFYRYMLPCENIDKFIDYFEKCTLFLPSSVEGIPRARCLHCYMCYKKDSELRQHLIENHQFLNWPFKCDHCPERFLDVDDYELHKSLPHYVEIFKCPECNKRFNRRGLYNKHKSSHKNTTLQDQQTLGMDVGNTETTNNTAKYVCNICKKEFKRASNLNYHNIFHGEKKYKCYLCPKTFYLKSYLRLHIMKHKNESNFICEVCGKGFVRSTNLNNHMRTHTGDKVTCNICNIKLSKSSLPRHRRLVHLALEGTVESTYRAKCHRYKQRTTTTFTRTKESRPRQYNCKICQLPFERLKLLKDHNKEMHNNVERTPCKICSITFRYKPNLKSHYREKHKLDIFQINKLVDKDEQLDVVLAIAPERTKVVTRSAHEIEKRPKPTNKEGKSTSTSAAVDYFDQEKIHSDALQDEIMKAVEHIDMEEIKIDDEHSMHEFFNDLLKN